MPPNEFHQASYKKKKEKKIFKKHEPHPPRSQPAYIQRNINLNSTVPRKISSEIFTSGAL